MKGFSFLKKRGGMFSPSPAYSQLSICTEAWLVILREALVAPTEASVHPSRGVEVHCENPGSRS